MLGRGAVTRPDLIALVDKHWKQADSLEDDTTLSWTDLIGHQIKFLEGAAKNDVVLVGRYKQWLGMLTKGYNEAQTLWEAASSEKKIRVAIIDALKR